MSTWNGIGTKFYGSKDQDMDDSFVTTEWFVVLYFPIIPVGTSRVIFKGATHGWRKTTNQYYVIQKLSMDWQQVFSTYFVAIASVVIGYWFSQIVGNWFPDSDLHGLALVVGFILPILIGNWLFLEPKPSKNLSPAFKNEASSRASNINLLKIPKPQITPPSELSEPDISLLEPLIKKYEPTLNQIMSNPYGKSPEWLSIKTHLDDLFQLNFQTISFYMESEVYKGNFQERKWWEEQIKTTTTMLTSCSWMIGKEWSKKDVGLQARLRNKETIGINDIPFDAMQSLAKAIYVPYFLFASVFIEYYNSEYGKKLSHQKDGHLKDIYQSIAKVAIACFLIGIKS